MEQIEYMCEALRAEQDYLAGVVGKLNADLERAKQKHLKEIREAVSQVAAARIELKEYIEANPGLFDKPKTCVLHGIKVGLRKGKGIIEYDDENRVIGYIEKHFIDDFDMLIKVSKKPVKSALAELDAADLRKMGVRVIDTGDEVVIKDTDTDIEKMVAAMIQEKEREAVDAD